MCGHSRDGYEALLAALAEYPQEAAGEIQITDVKADDLTHPQATSVERLKKRSIPSARRRVGKRLREQAIDIVDRNDVREPLRDLRQRQARCRMIRGDALANQELVQALHGCDVSLDGARREPFGAKRPHERRHVVTSDRIGARHASVPQEGRVALQVVTIR